MRIEQLQAFLAVADTGSFGLAAQQCQVTQSTISRQIQSLEQSLGLPLFHRSSQAKLTLGGEQLLPHARKMCKEWENVLRKFEEIKSGKQPELCVAAIHSVCAHSLPLVLQKFCFDYPNVQLRVTALGSDRALKVLKDGLVDLAIVMNNRFLTNSSEMVVDVLYQEEILVLMAANHPLTQYPEVSLSQLVDYPQAVFKDGYGMQRLIQDCFTRLQSPIKAVMELNTLDAFRGVVRQGHVIALLPESALIEAKNDPTLAIRRLAKSSIDLTREVVIVTTSDRLAIPPIAHFYKLVQQLLKFP
ncbi:LysR family transcriptional regulator [Gloeocapsa sp. PCC 73106]|uniref:LysR family transcriptional regulator n=1 Tax=Gloeocapsa sp. PCC 73106 TaxID=102232 RepID=UPI000308C36E|nr:LysR family transcriptional regulator [Gloeocapsa sp. PCC 73106]